VAVVESLDDYCVGLTYYQDSLIYTLFLQLHLFSTSDLREGAAELERGRGSVNHNAHMIYTVQTDFYINEHLLVKKI
jgi:hypothetical protein